MEDKYIEKMKQGDRNVLLNILNTLKRISDEDFIKENWEEGQGKSSIVISCCEGLEILDDYFFFDLVKKSKGYWKDYEKYLSVEVMNKLVTTAKKIDVFKGCGKLIDDLLIDESWLEIMGLSKVASIALEKELGVEDDDSYMI